MNIADQIQCSVFIYFNDWFRFMTRNCFYAPNALVCMSIIGMYRLYWSFARSVQYALCIVQMISCHAQYHEMQ